MTTTKARSCTGKQRHETRVAAQAAVRAAYRRGEVRVRAYKCKHCRGFHIGHVGKRRRQR